MNTIINSIANFKKEIIIALALILIGAGYSASYEAPYDPYTSRVTQIDVMMTELIATPTEANMDAAYWTLWDNGQWSGRNNYDGKENFEAYLEACNIVRLDLEAGKTADLSKMKSLKNKLI